MKRTFRELVEEELKSGEYEPVHSGYEGYAFLKESLDKFWSMVHGRPFLRYDNVGFTMVKMAVIAQKVADYEFRLRGDKFQDYVTEQILEDSKRDPRIIHSPHEGYAILKALLDDYWKMVRTWCGSDGKSLSTLVEIAVIAQYIAEDFANVAVAEGTINSRRSVHVPHDPKKNPQVGDSLYHSLETGTVIVDSVDDDGDMSSVTEVCYHVKDANNDVRGPFNMSLKQWRYWWRYWWG